MKPRTMRLVDRWLGVPLCAILTVHRWVLGFRRRPKEKPHRIVLVKLAEQGSTVLAYPAIRRAIELVGQDNVFFLVFEENRFILECLDLVPRANILTIPTGSLAALAKGLIAAIMQMRRERTDAAVDLEFFARSSAALCYLSGASRRAGFHARDGGGPWRGDLMTHRLSYNPHLHISQVFAIQVESLNAQPDQLPAMAVAPS
ncbi:MAG TPA: glycosyltransferase family 9 protein, partial [Phycisphaerae bacterium]|nr:glycosyltransferase family 9 protein [Phycisphaerae bacterium]